MSGSPGGGEPAGAVTARRARAVPQPFLQESRNLLIVSDGWRRRRCYRMRSSPVSNRSRVVRNRPQSTNTHRMRSGSPTVTCRGFDDVRHADGETWQRPPKVLTDRPWPRRAHRPPLQDLRWCDTEGAVLRPKPSAHGRKRSARIRPTGAPSPPNVADYGTSRSGVKPSRTSQDVRTPDRTHLRHLDGQEPSLKGPIRKGRATGRTVGRSRCRRIRPMTAASSMSAMSRARCPAGMTSPHADPAHSSGHDRDPGAAAPPPRARVRRKTARRNTPATRRHRSWSHARRYRSRCGRLKTHCRTATSGMT
jgi:hypothetical protein